MPPSCSFRTAAVSMLPAVTGRGGRWVGLMAAESAHGQLRSVPLRAVLLRAARLLLLVQRHLGQRRGLSREGVWPV